jgi:site-specific recombinase XerD
MGRRSLGLKLPPGCKSYLDHTGTPRTYYRHTPATPLPGLPWSPEFMTAYTSAKLAAGRDKPAIGASRTKHGSLDAALVRYYLSDDFTAMAPSSRGQNRRMLERWRVGRGERPLRELEHKHVQGYIGKLPSAAVQRNALRSIRPFMKFCIKENLIATDPSLGVLKQKMPKTGGFRPWTEENVVSFTTKHPIGTTPYLALQIMLCTSLRRSDAVEIGPRHVRKSAQHPLGMLEDYQPVKGRRTGGRLVNVPIHPDLAASIAAMDVIGSETFLLSETGKPFTVKWFGKKMREWCDAAQVPPLVDENGKAKNIASHGLRKLCLTRLAEAGCTLVQMQGISGHKDLKELQVYIDGANRKIGSREAMEKLLAAQAAGQKANAVCLIGRDN